MIADPTNGDISTTTKAYNALSAFPYSSRYQSNEIDLFPKLNLTQWNSAFQTLCAGMCSMLGSNTNTISYTDSNTNSNSNNSSTSTNTNTKY